MRTAVCQKPGYAASCCWRLRAHWALSAATAFLAPLIVGACGPKETNGLDAKGEQPISTVTVAGMANLTGAVAPTGSAWGAPNDGEWTMAARDYANTRYSPLKEITADNVSSMELAWTFDNGVPRGQEGSPLVAGNTMYIVTPFPNVAYALDLTKPGAPIKWKFEPNPSPVAAGKACCDVVNRGWTLADGKLIYNLLDDHTVAVDTASGKEVWRTQLGNPENGSTMTMAPIVVRDRVLVGNSGGEMGVQGVLSALDVHDGKILACGNWRTGSSRHRCGKSTR